MCYEFFCKDLFYFEYLLVFWIIYGFKGKSVFFNIKGKYVFIVMLLVVRGFLEFIVVYIGREYFCEVTLVIFFL